VSVAADDLLGAALAADPDRLSQEALAERAGVTDADVPALESAPLSIVWTRRLRP
jgi:hypothetical protein